MSDRDSDSDLDLDALSALVRPAASSTPRAADEDDGKIDLRALASSSPAAFDDVLTSGESDRLSIPTPAPAAPVASQVSARQGSVSAPATAPRPASGRYFFAVVAVAAIAVVGLAWALLGPASDARLAAGPSAVTAAAAAAPVEPAAIEVSPAADEPAAEEPVEVEQPEPEAIEVASANEPADVEVTEQRAEGDVGDRPGRGRARSASRADSAEPVATVASPPPPAPEPAAPAPAPEPRRSSGESHGMDTLLDRAVGGSAATETRSAEPVADDRPETPNQAEVRRILGRFWPQIRECAAGQIGLAVATLMVRSDGTVASVSVSGAPFAGSPQGACIEDLLRRATFPPFRQSQFRVQYPMSIRPGL